jgi:RNA polymerase sigma-70 factor (ECF subfamily)
MSLVWRLECQVWNLKYGILVSALDLSMPFGQRQPMAATPAIRVPDDCALVTAAQRGDREAFAELYRRYARMVHGVLLSRAPWSDVDDLVQDVFLLALRRLSSLREPAAFGGWLAMIARNRATDYFRRARETSELPEHMPGRHTPSFEARAAFEAICSLPETYRETLILRLVEGMTGPEIAARTGMTPASVRVNLHRGLKQLRAKMGITATDEH